VGGQCCGRLAKRTGKLANFGQPQQQSDLDGQQISKFRDSPALAGLALATQAARVQISAATPPASAWRKCSAPSAPRGNRAGRTGAVRAGPAAGVGVVCLTPTPGAGMLQVSTDGQRRSTLCWACTRARAASFAGLTEVGCGYSTNYATEGQPSVVIHKRGQRRRRSFFWFTAIRGPAGVAQLQIGLGQPLAFRSLPASQLVDGRSRRNAVCETTAIGATPLFLSMAVERGQRAGRDQVNLRHQGRAAATPWEITLSSRATWSER
jgi:hypothetical protein